MRIKSYKIARAIQAQANLQEETTKKARKKARKTLDKLAGHLHKLGIQPDAQLVDIAASLAPKKAWKR